MSAISRMSILAFWMVRAKEEYARAAISSSRAARAGICGVLPPKCTGSKV